jgi:hypothetical protein
MPDAAEPPDQGTPTPEAHRPGSVPPPLRNEWSTEHYGFVGPPPPPVETPQPGAAPTPPGRVEEGRPWWNRGRTLAAAGVAAAICAVGALGFTVGHAAATGPHQPDGTSDVGRGPDGPAGRDFGR